MSIGDRDERIVFEHDRGPVRNEFGKFGPDWILLGSGWAKVRASVVHGGSHVVELLFDPTIVTLHDRLRILWSTKIDGSPRLLSVRNCYRNPIDDRLMVIHAAEVG